MSVVIWDRSGKVLTRLGAAPIPEFDPGDGFATLDLGQPPEAWRVFRAGTRARGAR